MIVKLNHTRSTLDIYGGFNMNVFIGWSGPKGKAVARCLREWLDKIFQGTIQISMSTDIPTGKIWNQALNEQLQEADAGILCITSDSNLNWLCYEAGILSSSKKHSYDGSHGMSVVPFLVDAEMSLVPVPLWMYQFVRFDSDAIINMVLSLYDISYREDAKGLTTIRARLSYEELKIKIKETYPDFEKAMVDAIKITYTVDDLAAYLDSLQDHTQSTTGKYLYHRGQLLLTVLRSNSTLTEKANELTEFRETIEAFMKQDKYNALSNELMKLYNFTELLSI